MALFAFLGFLVFLKLLFFAAIAISAKFQRMTHDPSFLRGKVPEPLPEGFYKGVSHLFFGAPVPWKGKQFKGAEQKGINILTQAGQRVMQILTPRYKKFQTLPEGLIAAYEFQMSTGASVKNPHQRVLSLDYNIEENPSLVRMVRDELVEVDPGRFLGKVHLQILPGLFWTIGYFTLQKSEAVTVPAAPEQVPSTDTPKEVAPRPATSSVPVAQTPESSQNVDN
jgi:hypothetical protein